MNYTETTRLLFNMRSQGAKFGIGRMRLLAAALGNPERRVPAIHIAGSNGKGSVAAMLEQILRDAGLRTGLYTSPHLVRLGERVQVNRVPLSDAAVCDYAAELLPIAARLGDADPADRPSFFEFMTAVAFLEFWRRRVDVAIVETGLGGRLDATNILVPVVSVITSISLEHTEYLGSTLEEVAAEKGGIIKPQTPVALGLLPPPAEAVLRRIAREQSTAGSVAAVGSVAVAGTVATAAAVAGSVATAGSVAVAAGTVAGSVATAGSVAVAGTVAVAGSAAVAVAAVAAGTVSLSAKSAPAQSTPSTMSTPSTLSTQSTPSTPACVPECAAPVFCVRERFSAAGAFPPTNLAGAHQHANAALALLAAELFAQAQGRDLPLAAARASLLRVEWPARWQIFPLSRQRRLIIDAAHNAECAAAVEPLVAQIARDTGRPPLVITGVLGPERARPLLAMLVRHARRFHLVRPEQDRACDFSVLESCFPKNLPPKTPPKKNVSPKNASPENTSFENTPFENVPPKNVPPENTSPKNVFPENVLPKNVFLENVSPVNIPSESVSLKNVPPENISPKNVFPENVSPVSIPSESAPPKNVFLENVPPENAFPENILPKNVPPKNVLPKNVFPENVSLENLPFEITRDTVEALFPALGECRLGDIGDTILVLGSVYLAGEVLARFRSGTLPETALQDKLP